MPTEKILQRETGPTTTIHNKLHINCLWSISRSPRWKTSEWVAEMWHRPGWLYHQWSCGTDLAGCITSGAVAQTWLNVSPVELWHRPGWLYHQWSCGTDLADFITNRSFTSRILIGHKFNLCKEQRHTHVKITNPLKTLNGLILNISARLHDNPTEKTRFPLGLMLPISFQVKWLSLCRCRKNVIN
jgi:hypothetical protein